MLAAPVLAQESSPALEPDWSDRPALVVIVVVDQLATSVLRSALPYCGERGFKRLLREGATFPACAYRHACTETGPGHATLATGADPCRHGIIANEWRDPTNGKKVYCVLDEAQAGVGGDGDQRGPKNLLVPTLGDQMKCYFGTDSKVVSLSWKDRSAVLLGGHAPDTALWFSKRSGLLVTTTAYARELPAWAEAFQRERPAERYFGRVWQRFGPARAYAGLVDDVPFERVDFNNARTLPAVIDGGEQRPGARFYEHLYESPFANELLLDVALQAVRELRLGLGGPPDLLCVSFSSNDVIGHRNGPQSVEARDMTLRTDDLLARLLDTLDREVGAARCAVMLSADHGVQPIPELAKARGVPAGRGPLTKWAASAVEAALMGELGARAEGTWVLAAEEGLLYLDREAIRASGAHFPRARRTAAAAAMKARGVALACPLDDLLAGAGAGDALIDALRCAAHPERSPDVVLVPHPLWLDGTTPAMHGTPWPADREVPLLVAGKGIRAGVESRAEVGPGLGVVLLAELLGIPRPPGAREHAPDVFAR